MSLSIAGIVSVRILKKDLVPENKGKMENGKEWTKPSHYKYVAMVNTVEVVAGEFLEAPRPLIVLDYDLSRQLKEGTTVDVVIAGVQKTNRIEWVIHRLAKAPEKVA